MSITKLDCMELQDTRYSVYPYNGYNLEEILGKFYEAIKECNDLSFSLQEFNQWLIAEGLQEELLKQLPKIDWDKIINSDLYQKVVNELKKVNIDLSKKIDDIRNIDIEEKEEINLKINQQNEKYKEFMKMVSDGWINLNSYIIDDNITSSFENAINEAKRKKLPLFIPLGEWIITRPITLYDGMTIFGCGVGSVINCNVSDGIRLIKNNGSYARQIKISNLQLKGNSLSNGIYADLCTDVTIEDCLISGFKNGIVMTYGWNYHIRNNIIERNIENGILLQPQVNGALNNIYIQSNTIEYNKTGVKIGIGADLMEGNTVFINYNCIQVNNTSQVQVNSYTSVDISNNYFESYKNNYQYVIHLGSYGEFSPKNISIKNNTISRYNDFPYTGILIEKGDFINILENVFWSGNDDKDIWVLEGGKNVRGKYNLRRSIDGNYTETIKTEGTITEY